MVAIKSLCTCTLFLMLLLSNDPLPAHGRWLLRRKQKACKRCPVQGGQTREETGMTTSAGLTGDNTHRALLVEDSETFRPTAPGHSPGVGHSLKGEVAQKDTNIGDRTLSVDTQDLKPTVPGHSPGVGHVLDHKDSSSVGRTMSAYAQDFRPTMPGHSPGVGHSSESIAEEKSVDKLSVAERASNTVGTQDFRPTEPGHSPGVSHSFWNKGN